jgi:hypothetical protein
MRATFRPIGRAMLTLLVLAAAFTAAPAATANAAPDRSPAATPLPNGSVPGFTMLANPAKPTVDIAKAKVMRFTDRAGTNASVTCYYTGPFPPYYLDLLCYVDSGVVSVFVDCSNGVRLYSTPMAAIGQYYGRATCGPPAYAIGIGSIALA